MKFQHQKQPNGKCAYCGESTVLPIHADCGESYRRRHKQPAPRPSREANYPSSFCDAMRNTDHTVKSAKSNIDPAAVALNFEDN